MGPKIDAAIQFIEGGGQKVLITSIEKAEAALRQQDGTWILPD
jgi:carbamate kinase